MTPFIAIPVVLLMGVVAATIKAPRLTSIIFWSLTATIFLTAALLLTLPFQFSELALWVALSVSLIWAGLQFWCYWDGNKWRVAGGLIVLTLVSGTVVYLVDPLV